MIDFENAKFLKLRPVDNDSFHKIISPILIEGEEVVGSFRGIRDGVVFTSRRVISINVQGATGMKKDITSLPYRKIQAFSVETSGFVDIDCELQLWFSSIGKITFEFLSIADVSKLCKVISYYTL